MMSKYLERSLNHIQLVSDTISIGLYDQLVKRQTTLKIGTQSYRSKAYAMMAGLPKIVLF